MLLPRGNFCVLFTWRKVISARRVTRCWTAGNPPLEVAPGQRKTHVNSYRRQTVHRGKVDPGVSELPRGNKLSRDHVNRPLSNEKGITKCVKPSIGIISFTQLATIFWPIFTDLQNEVFSSNLNISAKYEPN